LIKTAIILVGLTLLSLPALITPSGGGGVTEPADAAAITLLPLYSVIPFAGMLLSIALFPLMASHWWENNLFYVAVAWSLVFLVPLAIAYGPGVAGAEFYAIILLDYLPFVILLAGLFAVTGSIVVRSSIAATPVVNVVLLLAGTLLASLVGTTGASMLLIRVVLKANAWRKKRAHVVVFFIFLVANIGGSLTPIGDPPLFLGFLRGVPFFWTLNLLPLMLLNTAVLLTVFFLVDRRMYAKELAAGRLPHVRHKEPPMPQRGTAAKDATNAGSAADAEKVANAAGVIDGDGAARAAKTSDAGRTAGDAVGATGADKAASTVRATATGRTSGDTAHDSAKKDKYVHAAHDSAEKGGRIQLAGLHNLIFLAMIVAATVLSGVLGTLDAFKNPATGEMIGIPFLYGLELPLNNALQMAIVVIAGTLAMLTTKKRYHEMNEFGWEPIKEVAFLFIGIFITMIPALELLHVHGPNLGLSTPWQFFWATGLLSSFLDNAPTYLVFLTTATSLGLEGIPTAVGSLSAQMLLAVSAGAVFMGANTYIGNAPNFMVRSIAEKHHVKMPSFFGYLAWSATILLPLFLLDTLIFFVLL
jgi:Na+/H+ antiporter NhaD/arsenite permease-like protein